MKHQPNRLIRFACCILAAATLVASLACSGSTDAEPAPPLKRILDRPGPTEFLTADELQLRMVGSQPDIIIDESGNFLLMVGAFPRVDVRVWIDDRLVIDDVFESKAEFDFVTYQISVPKGTHRMKAVSNKGQSEYVGVLEIVDKHWGLLEYYCPNIGKDEPYSPRFSFDIQDKPFQFL